MYKYVATCCGYGSDGHLANNIGDGPFPLVFTVYAESEQEAFDKVGKRLEGYGTRCRRYVYLAKVIVEYETVQGRK